MRIKSSHTVGDQFNWVDDRSEFRAWPEVLVGRDVIVGKNSRPDISTDRGSGKSELFYSILVCQFEPLDIDSKSHQPSNVSIIKFCYVLLF